MRISEKAAEEIKRLASKRGRITDWVQLGIVGGGCGGFKYYMSWMEPPLAMLNTNHLFEEHGVKIFVDEKSYLYIRGTFLDFDSFKGFNFQNPNVRSTCGCGESVEF